MGTKVWRLAMALVTLAGVMLQLPVAARATEWCGENGLVRFSFAAGDSLVEVLETGEPENGVTLVEVYAWLTDVDPVARDGDRFLRVGGFELRLTIDGAEGFILKQDFPTKALNVGRKSGEVVAGLQPGQRLVDGRTYLVHWQVMFQGRPQDVRFGLDPGGTASCGTIEGCPEAGPQMLYVGVESGDQLGDAFGAGYVPAWLNPTVAPAQTPVRGKQTYSDVGRYQKR